MKLTLKKNVDISSVALQHGILIRATGLIAGREGVLETEKELYLILSIVDAMTEEDVVALCNEDDRELIQIMLEDIEPFFKSLLGETIPVEVYKELKRILLNRCKEIWDNQHSIVGVIDTILTTIGMMSEEDKKDALVQTAQMAEMAFERRTQTMEKKTEAANSKIEALIQQYQKASQETKENNTTE